MISASVQSTATSRGLGLSINRLGRYIAAGCGVVAVALFYQPWVDASLSGVGEQALTGLELARGDATTRVRRAAVAASRAGISAQAAPAASSGATSGGAAGGLTLPTRVPTVAAGSSGAGGLTLPTRVPTVPAGTTASGASAGAGAAAPAAGGLTLPTRVPTVAAGGATSAGTFGTSSGVAQATPVAPASSSSAAGAPANPSSAPALPAAPETLPQFPLYLVPLAGLGIAVFSVLWDRLVDLRDRRFGKAWTLILAFGGTLGAGNVLYKAVTASAENSLIGEGVGSVVGVQPALWGIFLAFLISAVCLAVAWLSPAPPPPDRYARVRT